MKPCLEVWRICFFILGLKGLRVKFLLSDEHSRPHHIVVNPWGYFYPLIAYHLKKSLKIKTTLSIF